MAKTTAGAISPSLARAWTLRQRISPDVLEGKRPGRVFHGPGEGDTAATRGIAIDRFGQHAWITDWEGACGAGTELADELSRDLKSLGFESGVRIHRPEGKVPTSPEVLWGDPPKSLVVEEHGAKFEIQLRDSLHPGLFLDHEPLRCWLAGNCKGLRVLNTFAYTGSLSVAAGLGGAVEVVTLDLSRPTTEWARRNWELNGLHATSEDFVFGDVFEWLPKWRKRGRVFDLIILDPPSFSRGKKGGFSTSKDLTQLHALALELLVPGGMLATSINSAQVSWGKYQKDVSLAARKLGVRLEEIQRIELPESFPVSREEDAYLKGWILKRD